MADLKTAIKDMAKKGLSEQTIISNLRELGVQNAEKVYKDAVADLPKQTASESEPQLMQSGNPAPAEQPKVFTNVGKTTQVVDLDELNSKVDDVAAQLKALAELNKKILDTNRDILLRLKRS